MKFSISLDVSPDREFAGSDWKEAERAAAVYIIGLLARELAGEEVEELSWQGWEA